MSHTKLALLSLVVLPAIASAQADTTRRRDTTRTQRDTVSRTQREARGEVERFSADRRNYGLSSEQAMELQRALSGAGCDAGSADGIVGPKTRRAVDCYRRQRNISGSDLEGVITALNLSFARPDTTAAPAPAKRDTSVMPPVIRQDTSMRRDTSTRRDTSARRDTTRRDTTRRDTTGRRPF